MFAIADDRTAIRDDILQTSITTSFLDLRATCGVRIDAENPLGHGRQGSVHAADRRLAVHAGVLDGPVVCRMLGSIVTQASAVPRSISSDHDSLFEFHRWKVDFRVLDIDEIKTVPDVQLPSVRGTPQELLQRMAHASVAAGRRARFAANSPGCECRNCRVPSRSRASSLLLAQGCVSFRDARHRRAGHAMRRVPSTGRRHFRRERGRFSPGKPRGCVEVYMLMCKQLQHCTKRAVRAIFLKWR